LHANRDVGDVFVSDFDGTMTLHDFYQLAIAALVPPGTPDYWAEYRAGAMTHFEALRSYFAAIRASEEEVLAVVARMELDPGLSQAVESLRRAGWRVVIASAGCAWYIQRLLANAGVKLEVFANPGRFEPGQGLIMEMPARSAHWSPTLGVDKMGLVRAHLATGARVAFAGDGYPDVDSARLVAPELRFARGDLAAVLRREGLAFHPFDQWTEIAQVLTKRGT
jgi:2-hydroxy-3-keto-5-methylthiopentenyl-1-phosphate phosphatase